MRMRTVGRRSGQGATGGQRPELERTLSDPMAYGLGEVRRAREITQVEVAQRLEVAQATVSKFEKSNPAVSTVRRYVEALGGQLEVVAVFDDDRVLLDY